MTTEMWIIAAFRIGSALPVLRWPLAGAFIAVFADLFDLFLRDWLDLGGVKDYQTFDKWLDQAYMCTFLLVALRWHSLARNIAVALYAFRLAGFITFELTGDREILILFPNAFEYWFIFVAALKHFHLEETEQPPVVRMSRSQSARGTQRIDFAQALNSSPQLSLTGAAESSPCHSVHSTLESWPVIGTFIRFAVPFRYSRAQLLVALAVVFAAKMLHEYMLHVGQWFEGFTPTEALEAIWQFLTPPY
jgi:hypothetical protein